MADDHCYFDEASWTLFESDEAPAISPKLGGTSSITEAQQNTWSDENHRRWDMDITPMFVDVAETSHTAPPHTMPPATGFSPSSKSNSVTPDSQTTLSGLGASVISHTTQEATVPDSLPSGDQNGPHLCRAVTPIHLPIPPLAGVSPDSSTPSAVPSANAFDDEANLAASSPAASSPSPPPSLPQSAENAKELTITASTTSSADQQSQAASPSPPSSPAQSAEPPEGTTNAASTESSAGPQSPAASPSPPPDPHQAADPENPPSAAAPPVPVGMSFPATKPNTYYTQTFPPGQDRPGFVPFGRRGRASVHQGNYWPINLELRSQLIRAETDANKLRSDKQRLTYGQVLTKYNTWNGGDGLNQNTMRYHNRKFSNPIRDRVVKFRREHLRALRRAVPASRNARGKVAWTMVREMIEEDTGRLFGLATLVKQWRKMGNE